MIESIFKSSCQRTHFQLIRLYYLKLIELVSNISLQMHEENLFNTIIDKVANRCKIEYILISIF